MVKQDSPKKEKGGKAIIDQDNQVLDTAHHSDQFLSSRRVSQRGLVSHLGLRPVPALLHAERSTAASQVQHRPSSPAFNFSPRERLRLNKKGVYLYMSRRISIKNDGPRGAIARDSPFFFSPIKSQIAWATTAQPGPYDRRRLFRPFLNSEPSPYAKQTAKTLFWANHGRFPYLRGRSVVQIHQHGTKLEANASTPFS